MLSFIISDERHMNHTPPAEGTWVKAHVIAVHKKRVSEETRISQGDFFYIQVQSRDKHQTRSGEVGPYTWYDEDPEVGQPAWLNLDQL